jgi:hypothetical protein
MATKPETKTKKTDSTTTKPDAAKPDAAKAETSSADASTSTSTADGDSSSGSSSAGKSSAPSRPISYFSSVSTNEYRSGWDDIFSSGGKKSSRKAVKPAAKRNSKLPATITLEADDLDPGTREQLEAVFRQHAKKKRLNYDKLSGNGQVSWQISCRISNA